MFFLIIQDPYSDGTRMNYVPEFEKKVICCLIIRDPFSVCTVKPSRRSYVPDFEQKKLVMCCLTIRDPFSVCTAKKVSKFQKPTCAIFEYKKDGIL